MQLNCVTEPVGAISCCEPPYVRLAQDCVEACLNEKVIASAGPWLKQVRARALFGTKVHCADPVKRLSDLYSLRDLLLWIYYQRLDSIEAGDGDTPMQDIWDDQSMSCIIRRYSSVHRIDVRSWLLQASIEDPAHPFPAVQSMPSSSTVACVPQASIDCEVTVTHEVILEIDWTGLPASPSVDDAYYIISGQNTGYIAQWSGTVWNLVPVANGEVVANLLGDYWVNLGNGPGLLFPLPVLTHVTGGTYELSVNTPQTAQNRQVRLYGTGPEGFVAMSGWLNESSLPQQIDLSGFSWTSITLRYAFDGCLVDRNGASQGPPAPCEIVPRFTIAKGIDFGDIGTTPNGIYLITSGAEHVDEIVTVQDPNPLVYEIPAEGDIIYDSDLGVYLQATVAGIGPLFPEITLINGLGQYTVQSQYPAISAVGSKFLFVVEQGSGTIIWSGVENQLPSTVPIPIQYQDVEAWYVLNGCNYPAQVTVVTDDPVIVEFECDEDNLYQYRYTATFPQQILITAPTGQAPVVQFAAGEMDINTVIRIYDGADPNVDPIIVSGSYADLGNPPLFAAATQPVMLIEIDPSAAMPDDLATWLFAVSCIQTNFSAAVTVTDDCDTYQFNISVQVDFGAGLSYNFEVYVNGSPVPVIFGPYSGEATYDLGDYPIGATVSVIMRNDADPTDYLWLGNLVTNGDCPNDPCAPESDYYVRLYTGVGDCSPVPPDGSMLPGIVWLFEEETCVGIPPGVPFTWDFGLGQYAPLAIAPGTVYIDVLTGEYYIAAGPGVVVPYFHLTEAQATGNTPLNFQFRMPAILQFGLTTNRPVAIQMSLDGITWTTVWSGFEQALANWSPAAITGSFTQMRSLWYYDTCGYVGPVQVLG